jgi:hypothetical protein
VFSDAEESEPEKYILATSKLFHGLTTKDVRNLAYHYAIKNNATIPTGWCDEQHASSEWLSLFLKRKNKLSIRTPQATNLGRTTSCNKHNVEMFFANLGKVYDKYNFQWQDMYNVDETAVTTVQKPTRIISRKGVNQVGAMTSTESGSVVTMALAASASGNSIPPFFVFPRENYRGYFTANGPEGSTGSVNQSGWITGDDFLLFMEHFIKHTRGTKDRPELLLLENH